MRSTEQSEHVIEKDQNIIRRLSIKQEFKQRQSKNINEHK